MAWRMRLRNRNAAESCAVSPLMKLEQKSGNRGDGGDVSGLG